MTKLNRISLRSLLLLFFISGNVYADFSGRVVRIIDGDTVDVLAEGHARRVRLAGIDAPESGQAYGTKSKQYLSSLLSQQQVDVIESSTDRYGRSLGKIIVRNAISSSVEPRYANYEMVAKGYAWAYRYHGKPVDEIAAHFESQAREQRVGLWSDPGAVEPWKWRHQYKR